MFVHNLVDESAFDTKRHVEKILGNVNDGDFTVACWEPGQCSPYHCHPEATEIYFCYQGGGVMKTPEGSVQVKPGGFVVHPPGEMHEYENGPERTLLFRVRYGGEKHARATVARGHPEWKQRPEDIAYFNEHPVGG
ncbi:cupin domain-containing protein [Pseudomonadota bacterium]